MSSRELTPIPGTPGVEEAREGKVTDTSLKELLKREVELQLEIDAVQTEISQLEEQLGYQGGEIVDAEGKIKQKLSMLPDIQSCFIDLEEFEAPEWCIPIKANVMTYDWEVKKKKRHIVHSVETFIEFKNR
jgi:mRNA (2'-O-methyladenosine-N6-)-methyltransferase